MKTVSIIGLAGHAQRLRSILENIAIVEWLYHPSKKIDDVRSTNEFLNLLKSDAIVIASPNKTHFSYIKLLKRLKFNGLIFCEKPPAVSKLEIFWLSLLPDSFKRRIFFNFPFRFSNAVKHLNDIYWKGQIGNILSFSSIQSHGLAFKQNYSTSWRADVKQHRLGVLETQSIHMIDVALRLLGKDVKELMHNASNASKNGTAADTSQLTLSFGNIVANIFSTYAGPMNFELNVVGTNGQFKISDNRLRVYSGRDTFDKRGFFIQPPIILDINYDAEKEYEYALFYAVDNFIDHLNAGKQFSLINFDDSISVCRIINRL